MIKQVRKKSAKIDRWQGIMDERTAQLVKTTDELKNAVGKLHDNVDKKVEELKVSVDTNFKTLQTCVDSKFSKHNDFHINKEKKYRLYFLIITALAVGGCLANPESLKFVVNMITRFVGIL